jgi:NADH-quinone oxidoreductase subunit N
MREILYNLLPVASIVGAVLIIILVSSWFKRIQKEMFVIIAAMGVIVSIWFSWQGWLNGISFKETIFPTMAVFDKFSLISFIILSLASILTILSSYNYLVGNNLAVAEFLVLILSSLFGGFILASGTTLIMIFIGLEMLSLPAYILAGFNKTTPSGEAAIKYFILGAASSAIFLVGIAFYYGATGTINLFETIEITSHPMILLSAALIFTGLGFKIAAVPFQWWTPDVYQGAPLPVTNFFATLIKAAAFIIFYRLFLVFYLFSEKEIVTLITIMSILSMTIGNFAALFQEDFKRMLAYSSIAHAGYMMLTFVFAGANPAGAKIALLYYLIAYVFMTGGLFALLTHLAGKGREETEINRLSGLAKKSPYIAFVATILLLSLAGFPPMSGFFAKFYIFKGLLEAGHTNLVIIAVANSLISVYYYMRPIISIYFNRDGSQSFKETDEVYYSTLGVVTISLICVILLGLVPFKILTIIGL